MQTADFPVAASGKEPACQCRRERHKRCRFDPWVRKTPWRRAWQPTPVLLPRESHGQRSLVGYSPWHRKESDPTERLSTHAVQTAVMPAKEWQSAEASAVNKDLQQSQASENTWLLSNSCSWTHKSGARGREEERTKHSFPTARSLRLNPHKCWENKYEVWIRSEVQLLNWTSWG